VNLKTVSMIAVPVIGLLVVVWVISTLFDTQGPAISRRDESDLLVLCDEVLRYPIDAPDMEHEAGAIGRFFRRSGIKADTAFGRSEELYEALVLERTGDVFITADQNVIDQLNDAGLVLEKRKIARLVPYILVRRGNPHELQSVADLDNADIRLGVVSDQSGLLRRVTIELLENSGLSMHELDNITHTEDSPYSLGMAVNVNRVDAAIVWKPVARHFGRNTEMIAIDEDRNVISAVKAVVLTSAEKPENAAWFAEFLAGGVGRQMFEMYGFE